MAVVSPSVWLSLSVWTGVSTNRTRTLSYLNSDWWLYAGWKTENYLHVGLGLATEVIVVVVVVAAWYRGSWVSWSCDHSRPTVSYCVWTARRSHPGIHTCGSSSSWNRSTCFGSRASGSFCRIGVVASCLGWVAVRVRTVWMRHAGHGIASKAFRVGTVRARVSVGCSDSTGIGSDRSPRSGCH